MAHGDLVLAVRAVEPVLVALGEELVVAVVALELVVVRTPPGARTS